MSPMPPRFKKLLGLFILLPGIAAYLAAAIILADRVPDIWLAKLVYFLVAGLAWAFPARYLMRWINAEPSRNGK